MRVRTRLLIRIAGIVGAMLAGSTGLAIPAHAATARHSPDFTMAATASCDREGHASIVWKASSTVGQLQFVGVTSVTPAGGTVSNPQLVQDGRPAVYQVSQTISGTHGKGTASLQIEGFELTSHVPQPDPNVPPQIARGSVEYDCTATLPVTGSSLTAYVAAGVVLVAGGVGLLMLARRRSRRPDLAS